MRIKPQTYVLTAVADGRRHIFQRTSIAELLITTLFRNRDADRFHLHAFVVMPNHIHVLLTPSPSYPIERCAQFIKGGFSHSVRNESLGTIWQTGYHAHRVTDQTDLLNQLRYIEQNPARKHLQDYPHIHTNSAYTASLNPISTI